ncbi:hypothetical protein EL84_13965 [Paenibacillus sp. VT-400]|uniref:stalk domain-containing protein n=1 Tax=Paenibacillus sp. VT-400 TaxID=1495853 RepID=UPI00064A02E5|nr:stalk domain-containing protein [Paenibacillus sp. VT-400]KLU53398.1 hypothetical protein EL84_13965 [Paenibacillus sp. VT-400]
MKRSRIMRNSFLLLLVFAMLCPSMAIAKSKSVEIRIDGVKLSYNSQRPEIFEGVIMSPYTPVLKKMNAKYVWNSKNKTLTIEKEKSKLILTIGSKKAVLNNKFINLDASPRLIEGNIYIPVKSVALAFGAELETWDSSNNTTLLFSFTDYAKMIRALVNDDYDKVKKLVDMGVDLQYRDKNGDNYLHIAAFASSVEINRLLLEKGVSTNQLNKLYSTPLSVAIMSSAEDVVKLLTSYTDLSVKPFLSYLDAAERQVEFNKKYSSLDNLKKAENIAIYLEKTLGDNTTGSTDKHPAATGETLTVSTTLSSNLKKSIGITVEQVLRGEEAWKKVAEAAYYNSPPSDGKEYVAIMVRVDLDYDSQKYIPLDSDFNLVNIQGDGYVRQILRSYPTPQFDYYFETKKDTSSWLIYSVPKGIELDQLILRYKGRYDSNNLAQFKLQDTSDSDKKAVDLSQLKLPTNISSMPSVNELNVVLEQNFSRVSVETQGEMNFEFRISKNQFTTSPYDYDIKTLFNFSKYYDLKHTNSITEEQRSLAFQQLKEHQEKIGMTLSALYPNVKFTGGYFDSWYKYPTIKVDFNSFNLNEWSNYDAPAIRANSYQHTKVSFFRWVNS